MKISAAQTKYICNYCNRDFMVDFNDNNYLNVIRISVSKKFIESHAFEAGENHHLKFNKINMLSRLLAQLKSLRHFKLHSLSFFATLTTQRIQNIRFKLVCYTSETEQIQNLQFPIALESQPRKLDEVFSNIFTALQSEFEQNVVPAFGTMLGLIRSKSIIVWDNDFDFWFKLSEDEDFNFQEIAKIHHFFMKRGYIENKKSNFSITYRHPVDKVVIDIYFVKLINNQIFSYLISGNDIDIYNLGMTDISHRSPLAEHVLINIYGPNWLVPDSSFKHQDIGKWEREKLAELSAKYFSKI